MAWIERIFEPDYILVRLGILLAALVGDLVWLVPGVTGRDWALGLAALVLAALCRWSPPAALLVQSGLLLYADWSGFAVAPVLKVLACVLLFELAVRSTGRQVLAGAVVLGVVVCFNLLDKLPATIGAAGFRMVIVVGVPLLLGGYVRLAREAARRERDSAAERIAAARAAERTAIARELHDLVAHHVSSMVLRVGVARHVLAGGADPRVTDVLDDLHSSGTAALADLRKLVGILRDPAAVPGASFVETGGLPDALSVVIDRARATGLRIEATIDSGAAQVDAVRGITVLRLTQEALANTAQHAGPSAHVKLGVTLRDDKSVFVEVEDDGAPTTATTLSGTDTGRRSTSVALASSVAAGASSPAAGVSLAGGHGLVGMRERVELLGGALSAGPVGRGWRLSAVLPPGREEARVGWGTA
ncbi:sensor histidine kinase [Acrocarpospora catenulata]|uniref:sensor histidine kinase n=1 Tax=Acrocarpospora catenulata TaxID=2836182 RepID=UPI001BD951E0|nr:histidine kinase [Acrocarpospora catenulata]